MCNDLQKKFDQTRKNSKIYEISESRINKTIANKIQAENLEWQRKQKEGITKKTKTKEWKDNQLNGTRNIRANGSWRENVKKGALKREQENTFDRKKLNKELSQSKEWHDAVKKGVKDRWNKPENLTKCPHCGKLCDNANYKRWHGDNCKQKGKNK
jgi:hypothetical protein